MNILKEFALYRTNRNKGGTNHRINKEALHHIVTYLLPFYPALAEMRSGERADFVIFLFEKALKQKDQNYLESWNADNYEQNKAVGLF